MTTFRQSIYTTTTTTDPEDSNQMESLYDLPYITPFLDRLSFSKYVPFLPQYKASECSCMTGCLHRCRKRRSADHRDAEDITVMEVKTDTNGNI